MDNTRLEKEIRRAVRPYSAPILFFYDAGVYKIWNPFIWKCPSLFLEEHFRQNVGNVHLEAGCGTGHLPHRYLTTRTHSIDSAKLLQLTLLDYSSGSLKWASRRLMKYNPYTIRHNLFSPLAPVSRPFDSICLNYVLHCLPGGFAVKQKVIGHLKEVLAPQGVLFGSSILGTGVTQSLLARFMLGLYNLIGSFHNTGDSAKGLKTALDGHFRYVSMRVIGSVALFAASDGPLDSAAEDEG